MLERSEVRADQGMKRSKPKRGTYPLERAEVGTDQDTERE